MALDEPQANDQVEVINGVQIAIEQDLIEYTTSLTLDYNEYRGFVLSGMQSC
ncbi:hypothetical protein [Niallia endozanthoxylica]|uniref:hypothetical protein n=1 Tax=Niallia endozanthoxylica TaxID=2036016 RepID=UPI00168BB229|nr:hypothetical protein [Niallia endozanthoxylica]